MPDTGVIQLLKASLNDVLRTNNYNVQFDFNKARALAVPEYGSYLVTSATFPFATLNTTEGYYSGIKRNIATSIDYDPASFVFIADSGGKILKFLTEWSNLIIDKDTNQIGFRDDYIAKITVDILTNFGTVAATVELYNAYPINIESISLGYSQNDEMVQISTSFKFEYAYYTIPLSLLDKVKSAII